VSVAPPLVLLDLDGTLSDSAPGIVRSAATALGSLGLEVPSDQDLLSFVGPPLPVGLRAHGVAEDRIAAGIAAYRAAFEGGGMWESHPFAGVADQLVLLREAGCTLAIATSKPEVYARQICDRWGLTALVDGVYGAPLDHVPSTKASVIAHALTELGESLVPPREAIVMVGDRHHDVDGAAEHGIVCLGVAWGYGAPGELDGAVGIIADVADLAADVLTYLARRAELAADATASVPGG
jgi:phosphoglycolate phosphatase